MSLLRTLIDRWDPASTAVIMGSVQLTYADLNLAIRRTAGWLEAQGVARGDVVAVQLPKGLPFLRLHLGAMAIGAAILPLHPAATDTEIDFLCSDAGATLRVLRDVEMDGPEREPLDLDANTIAILLYTSGTTGKPKGAPISHGNLGAMVAALHQAWHWSPDDVLLHALPLFHVHGLFVAQWGAMWASATSIWLPRFRVDDVLRHLPGTTVFMGVPTFYARLLSAAEDSVSLPGMRLFTSGSAPLPAAHHAAFERVFGHRILERYGMTEVGIVLSNPYEGERRPGSVGFPLPGVQAKVVRADGSECDIGEIGEICIGGPTVFRGYLGRPEATADALRDGWMHSGDLGFVDADQYIHVSGRAKDMILSGGLNVYPREVEAVVRAVTGAEVAVFGVPDNDLGERVAIAYEGPRLHDPLQALRERLSPYKLPRRWFPVESLPRNAMGKVQKAQLRQQFGVTVRGATHDDLEWLRAGIQAMASETEGRRIEGAGLERALEHERIWVAERNGERAGQAMVIREWSDWSNGWVWWLQSVYVLPDHRRFGTMHALYDQIAADARAAGALALRLYVARDNTVAQTVYERLGMQQAAHIIYEQDL